MKVIIRVMYYLRDSIERERKKIEGLRMEFEKGRDIERQGREDKEKRKRLIEIWLEIEGEYEIEIYRVKDIQRDKQRQRIKENNNYVLINFLICEYEFFFNLDFLVLGFELVGMYVNMYIIQVMIIFLYVGKIFWYVIE